MKETTTARINETAERLYRIANFAPKDRNQLLTAMDAPGLFEVREVVRLLILEQDRDTRHACAEAAQSGLLEAEAMSLEEAATRVHAACMNTQAI